MADVVLDANILVAWHSNGSDKSKTWRHSMLDLTYWPISVGLARRPANMRLKLAGRHSRSLERGTFLPEAALLPGGPQLTSLLVFFHRA
jgi:hypothetical protein